MSYRNGRSTVAMVGHGAWRKSFVRLLSSDASCVETYHVHACVRVCERVCMRACVRACVRASGPSTYDVRNDKGKSDIVRCAYFFGEGSMLLLSMLLLSSDAVEAESYHVRVCVRACVCACVRACVHVY